MEEANDRAANESFERQHVCGVEMHLEKDGHATGHLLACSQATRFMQQLRSRPDASMYTVTTLRMERHGGTVSRDVISRMSLDEAATHVALFTGYSCDDAVEVVPK